MLMYGGNEMVVCHWMTVVYCTTCRVEQRVEGAVETKDSVAADENTRHFTG